MALIGLHSGIEELLLASAIIFLTSVIYKVLINKEEARKIKEEQKEKQEKMKELQKTNPEEANRVMNEMLKLSNRQFKLMMKPMLVSFILIIIILPILPSLFPGAVVNLPFTLPYFGSDFGWLAWYMIVSVPMNSIFRKMLGVEI
jgi:uncharacterized membrane protein (DUF106 family)